jgi:disulfide bond formation protein DsbB
MIGIYHNLLYYKVLPESIAPCSQGVSCTDEQINWLGFISIPLLALGAFVVLIGLMTIIIKRKNNE